MKKNHTTILEKKSQQIRMQAAERRALRERLVSYMEYHPAQRVVTREDLFSVPRRAQWFSYSQWTVRVTSAVFGVFMLAIIPVAAEYAVPGDVLYSFKVHINEEFKATLAFSPYQKVAWEAERVERRIAEARLLAKEGKLTAETEAEIAATVREHTDTANRELAVLRETDADEAAVAQLSLESALEVQSAVLEGENDTSGNIAGAVQAAKDELKGNDSASSTPLSYERLVAHIEFQTTRAHELAESIAESVSPDEQMEMNRRLSDIDRAIANAERTHEDNSDEDVIPALRTVLSDIQKLIAFMTDIDVRNSVTLERLVPKRPTEEEQKASVEGEIKALAALRVLIIEKQAQLSLDSALAVEKGLENFDSAFKAVTDAVASGDFSLGEKNLEDARTRMMELEVLTTSVASTTDSQIVPPPEPVQ